MSCKVAQERDGDPTIRVGDHYYTWARRNRGVYFQHVACGYPRPTQLSDRKTAQIEEAVNDLDLYGWEPTKDDTQIESLQGMLGDVASIARDVASEYESSAENMPESLQYGTQAEAMREVASELESWADELESFEPTSDLELPDRTPDVEDDEYEEQVTDALQTWRDDVVSEAMDKLGEIPEYQG